MVDLTDSLGAIAVRNEILRQGHRVGSRLAEISGQPIDAERLRTKARHQCMTRWSADGLVAIGSNEPQRAGREAVNVRGFRVGIAVTSQNGFEVVHANKKHVRSFRSLKSQWQEC